ncbi:MAG: SagB family peptide dehydrogenase [Lachnospiraceae bacterium]|nr:SagB family peptide dehydrogenase [Lachnospiraceae bacterium]HIH35157.1 SagB/ThcOx family dehydrogenase [Methanosphaera sp.]
MDFKYVNLTNQHLLFSTDENNITAEKNSQIFNHVISGEYESPAFEYLLNLGVMRLNDVKSIGMYNDTNLAAHINNLKPYEEIINEKETIILPKEYVKIRSNLTDAMTRRHSTREFSGMYLMSRKEFSTILHYSFGLAKRTMRFNDLTVTTRHYASGGGLYPVTVYILINRVEGIPQGLYRYQPYSHSLLFITKELQINKLLQYGSFDFENYSFCVLYEADMNRVYVKYGELSLMTVLIETGLMSQNFDLVTSALNYNICQIAGFDKQYAEHCLGIDGVNSHVVYVNICGKE